jgi:hypothetical protein
VQVAYSGAGQAMTRIQAIGRWDLFLSGSQMYVIQLKKDIFIHCPLKHAILKNTVMRTATVKQLTLYVANGDVERLRRFTW